jgi:hypothetical protein
MTPIQIAKAVCEKELKPCPICKSAAKLVDHSTAVCTNDDCLLLPLAVEVWQSLPRPVPHAKLRDRVVKAAVEHWKKWRPGRIADKQEATLNIAVSALQAAKKKSRK